jgi:hypothetical protein
MAFRAETIAACASAIGAVASAVAAIVALVFLQHQEEIARTQLQATYLSNLFSKQVDSLGSLMATISEFTALVDHDKLYHMIASAEFKDSDIDTYYNRVKEQYSRYDNMSSTIFAKTEALYILVPKSLKQVIGTAFDASRDITSNMKNFIEKKPTKETYFKFSEEMQGPVDQLDRFDVECLRKILASGQPITDYNVTSCKASDEH